MIENKENLNRDDPYKIRVLAEENAQLTERVEDSLLFGLVSENLQNLTSKREVFENTLERIFEPFYTKKSMGRSGTGLGMSVVWGTVKDHGGYIDIISEEGFGTIFILYFPASRAETQAPSSVYIDDYLGNGESLLIIDDSPEQRDLAQRMMQRLGYDVHVAACGEEAIALVKNRSYDLLILDMIMPPGMDGLDTFIKIRKIVPEQKAIIASGYAESERVHKAQQIGAGSFIKKPFSIEKIGLAARKELDQG